MKFFVFFIFVLFVTTSIAQTTNYKLVGNLLNKHKQEVIAKLGSPTELVNLESDEDKFVYNRGVNSTDVYFTPGGYVYAVEDAVMLYNQQEALNLFNKRLQFFKDQGFKISQTEENYCMLQSPDYKDSIELIILEAPAFTYVLTAGSVRNY